MTASGGKFVDAVEAVQDLQRRLDEERRRVAVLERKLNSPATGDAIYVLQNYVHRFALDALDVIEGKRGFNDLKPLGYPFHGEPFDEIRSRIRARRDADSRLRGLLREWLTGAAGECEEEQEDGSVCGQCIACRTRALLGTPPESGGAAMISGVQSPGNVLRGTKSGPPTTPGAP